MESLEEEVYSRKGTGRCSSPGVTDPRGKASTDRSSTNALMG
jgi:hypothetical protein